MKHLVKLSNGTTVVLVEENNCLAIGMWDDGYNVVDSYVASITKDGVLTYGNSGSACSYIVDGLTQTSDAEIG